MPLRTWSIFIFDLYVFLVFSSPPVAFKRHGEDDPSKIPDSHDASISAEILQDIGNPENIARFNRK